MRPVFESGIADGDTPWGSWRRYDGPNLTHTFTIVKIRDGDYLLDIGWWKATQEDPGRCWGVRFRNDYGGGNFKQGYYAMGKVLDALRNRAAHKGKPRNGKPAKAAEPMDWQWRDADDGFGHIGVAISAAGALMLALCPYPETYEPAETCETVLAVFWPATTPPALYAALAKFCQAVATDNAKNPGYVGNHA